MVKGIVILQARMGSTRLPGKVLREIAGRPMLYYTIHSLKASEVVEKIVIATSTNKRDDPLEEFAGIYGCECFRGDEEDVLDRFYRASLKFRAPYYFRATGDNPIVDSLNPGRSIKHLLANGLDYCCESEMPVGSVVETFTSEALRKCRILATDSDDREHVTLFMKKDERFKTEFFKAPKGYVAPEISLTVDYKHEFEKLEYIIGNLYKDDSFPDFSSLVEFVRKNCKGEFNE